MGFLPPDSMAFTEFLSYIGRLTTESLDKATENKAMQKVRAGYRSKHQIENAMKVAAHNARVRAMNAASQSRARQANRRR